MKRLRRRLASTPFSVLLLAALFLLLCGYSIYSIWLSVKPFGALTVNLAGRQRVLSEQIAKQSLMLVQESSVERRIELRQHAYGNAVQFQRVQHGLERGDKGLGLPGEDSEATRKILIRMAPNVRLLTSNVEAIYGLSPRGLMRLSSNAPAVQGIQAAAAALLVDYDDFLREYVAGAEREIVRYKVLETAVVIAAFLLILQSHFVVRRLGKQTQRFNTRFEGNRALLRQEFMARRRSEEERRLMVAAFEQANDSIVITDAQGKVRYVNAAFVRSTGYAKEEILGQTQSMLKSGNQDSGFYRQLWSTINSGHPWRGQMVNRRKDGTLRTETQAIFPIADRKGKIRHYAGIKRDITREVEMEQQLREAQKLEAIGVLAGGVAHDFNNILTPIIGFTSLTLDLVPKQGEAHDYLATIAAAANRAKDLVMQILNVARENRAPLQAIHLQAIVKEVLALMRSTVSKSIVIAEEIPEDLPSVQGNSGIVYRLLMNLCVNASQAMPDGGRLTVKLGLAAFDDVTGYLGEPAPGPFVRIEVMDTGRGMSEEIRSRIFEPYFTTRFASGGTGLGLFLVFSMVKQLKGGIKVSSRPNMGTTFEVIVPVPQTAATPADHSIGAAMPGHERILFVDDEEAIVKFAKTALERLGYRVTALMDSASAYALFQADPNQFDVVVTDRSMPGLPGEELARRIKSIRPSIPVILCSGYIDDVTEDRARAAGIQEMILKPFAAGQLSRIIRGVLDNRPPPIASERQDPVRAC